MWKGGKRKSSVAIGKMTEESNKKQMGREEANINVSDIVGHTNNDEEDTLMEDGEANRQVDNDNSDEDVDDKNIFGNVGDDLSDNSDEEVD